MSRRVSTSTEPRPLSTASSSSTSPAASGCGAGGSTSPASCGPGTAAPATGGGAACGSGLLAGRLLDLFLDLLQPLLGLLELLFHRWCGGVLCQLLDRAARSADESAVLELEALRCHPRHDLLPDRGLAALRYEAREAVRHDQGLVATAEAELDVNQAALGLDVVRIELEGLFETGGRHLVHAVLGQHGRLGHQVASTIGDLRRSAVRDLRSGQSCRRRGDRRSDLVSVRGILERCGILEGSDILDRCGLGGLAPLHGGLFLRLRLDDRSGDRRTSLVARALSRRFDRRELVSSVGGFHRRSRSFERRALCGRFDKLVHRGVRGLVEHFLVLELQLELDHRIELRRALGAVRLLELDRLLERIGRRRAEPDPFRVPIRDLESHGCPRLGVARLRGLEGHRLLHLELELELQLADVIDLDPEAWGLHVRRRRLVQAAQPLAQLRTVQIEDELPGAVIDLVEGAEALLLVGFRQHLGLVLRHPERASGLLGRRLDGDRLLPVGPLQLGAGGGGRIRAPLGHQIEETLGTRVVPRLTQGRHGTRQEGRVGRVHIEGAGVDLSGLLGTAMHQHQGGDLVVLLEGSGEISSLAQQPGEAQTVARVLRVDPDHGAVDPGRSSAIVVLQEVVGHHLVLPDGLVGQALASVEAGQALVGRDLGRIEADDLLVDRDGFDEETLACEVLSRLPEETRRLVDLIQPGIQVAHPVEHAGVVRCRLEDLPVFGNRGLQAPPGNQLLGRLDHLLPADGHQCTLSDSRGSTDRKVSRWRGLGP
jgi:hypothetical protein